MRGEGVRTWIRTIGIAAKRARFRRRIMIVERYSFGRPRRLADHSMVGKCTDGLSINNDFRGGRIGRRRLPTGERKVAKWRGRSLWPCMSTHIYSRYSGSEDQVDASHFHDPASPQDWLLVGIILFSKGPSLLGSIIYSVKYVYPARSLSE